MLCHCLLWTIFNPLLDSTLPTLESVCGPRLDNSGLQSCDFGFGSGSQLIETEISIVVPCMRIYLRCYLHVK